MKGPLREEMHAPAGFEQAIPPRSRRRPRRRAPRARTGRRPIASKFSKMLSRKFMAHSRRSPGCGHTFLGFDQGLKKRRQRRQVLLPTMNAAANRKVRITVVHGRLEIDAHARHRFSNYAPTSAQSRRVWRPLRARGRSITTRSFASRSGSSTVEQQVVMAAFAQQIADALVHRDAGGSDPAGHGRRRCRDSAKKPSGWQQRRMLTSCEHSYAIGSEYGRSAKLPAKSLRRPSRPAAPWRQGP